MKQIRKYTEEELKKFNIALQVCSYISQEPVDKILEEGRGKRRCSDIRFILMKIIHKNTGLSRELIGNLIGNRDHSTVTYGLIQYDNMYFSNKSFKNLAKSCKKEFGHRYFIINKIVKNKEYCKTIGKYVL